MARASDGDAVSPVDYRCEFAGFDVILEDDRIVVVLVADERAQLQILRPIMVGSSTARTDDRAEPHHLVGLDRQ